MNKIKFIYFDIGGVMNDWSDFFKSAAKKHRLTVEEINSVWFELHDDLTLGKKGPRDYWLRVIEKFNLKNAEDFDFLESWISDYKPRREIHKLAKDLSKKYKIGLLSNIYDGMMPRLIEQGIVVDIDYSAIVLSNEIGLKKPDREIYEFATEKARVKPNEILFIDDREDFIKGAQDYGWQTILLDPKNIEGTIKKIKKRLS